MAFELRIDDLHGTGDESVLLNFFEHLGQHVAVKIQGPLCNMCEYEHLGRKLERGSPHGLLITSSDKHIKAVPKVLELERAKIKPTPIPEDFEVILQQPHMLAPGDAGRYRTAVGILLRACLERCNAQFGIRMLALRVKGPTEGALKLAKHTMCYLQGIRSYGMLLPADETESVVAPSSGEA